MKQQLRGRKLHHVRRYGKHRSARYAWLTEWRSVMFSCAELAYEVAEDVKAYNSTDKVHVVLSPAGYYVSATFRGPVKVSDDCSWHERN